MKRLIHIALPLLVLAVSIAGAIAIIRSKPEPEKVEPEVPAPLVRTLTVELEDVRLTVSSQGTVEPRTESRLVPEVAGRVVSVASSFASGGFFEAGETLVRIDPFDYRQAVVFARAQVAQAALRVEREEAEAEVARREWEEIGNGEATPLTLRVPQLAEARAALDAAGAELERAERNLERTTLRAPYAGRVRSKSVDVGQYVTPGAPIATLYAVDYAEVRLPIPDADLAFIDVSLAYRDGDPSETDPEVVLRARFAGAEHTWRGRIVRTEGEIDATSRLVYVVARVPNPYGRSEDPDRPPLAVGMFVEAEILGRRVTRVAVLPRAAMRSDERLWIVDDDDRLRLREVDVLRRDRERVVVRAGLERGERVLISPIQAVTDGMQVRAHDDDGAPDDATGSGGRT